MCNSGTKKVSEFYHFAFCSTFFLLSKQLKTLGCQNVHCRRFSHALSYVFMYTGCEQLDEPMPYILPCPPVSVKVLWWLNKAGSYDRDHRKHKASLLLKNVQTNDCVVRCLPREWKTRDCFLLSPLELEQ